MSLLVVGRGPVAQALAASARRSTEVVLATRADVPGTIDLARAAAGRPWGLVAPGFLAQGRDPVRWWQPGGLGVGLAGEAADALRLALDPHRLRLRDVPAFAPLHAAVVPMATVAVLEAHGWDRRWAAADARRVVAVVQEAGQALAVAYGGRPARAAAPVVSAVLRLLHRVTPFDVDAYARDHFGRHGAQTRTLLGDWVRLGECFDRSARTTAALLAELCAADERRAAAA